MSFNNKEKIFSIKNMYILVCVIFYMYFKYLRIFFLIFTYKKN